MFPRYRQVILDKLKWTGGMPDIEERIVFEDKLTPQDIHERYKVLNGAIYGLSSHGNGWWLSSRRMCAKIRMDCFLQVGLRIRGRECLWC